MLLVELFSSNLLELANQPYPTNKIKNNWYEFDTDAGLTYHIWFNKKKIQDKIVVDLEFSLESAIGIARVEGTGDAFRVFATVADTLKDYMSNNKNFDMLTFSSYKDEPSRVKLYNRIASLLSKQFPELEFLETKESSDEIKYFFIRKNINESGLDQQAGIGIDGQSFKFNVKDLIVLANNYPVTKIDPKQFENQLSGREEDPTQSMARAQKAELKYPIIVVKRKNGELWIADGTHRAHKAIMMDLPTIDAKIIPVEDMGQFLVNETIRKVKGGYRLVSKSGKNLGTYPSKGGAEKREKQVQYFKHANESKRMHLDFDSLYGKAFKITDAEGDPNKPGFSIVTPSNTNAWTDWKEKPQFKNIVKQRLNDPNFLGDHKYLQIIDAMSNISEGPIWDKVKKTAAAGAVAGAAGYGALTGQFTDKAKEPARTPIEINIPGGDIQQPKPEIKKEKVKLEPSTATNANPEMEKIVFLTALRSGIKGKELAQFMGQVAHETLGFQRLVEVGNKEYFNRYDPKYSPQKAKILGNVKPGDGLRYKGRGFIQITGRHNYQVAGKALGIDLESNPKLASNPEVAAKIAVWYWKSRVKPAVDDYTDTIGVTSKINPSMNGLGDRDMNFRHYLQRLQLED